jgi:hypothetical protein
VKNAASAWSSRRVDPIVSGRHPDATTRATTFFDSSETEIHVMIRKLSSGQYRLYSRKKNPKTGKARNLGTFGTRAAAEKHERDVQYFKRH